MSKTSPESSLDKIIRNMVKEAVVLQECMDVYESNLKNNCHGEDLLFIEEWLKNPSLKKAEKQQVRNFNIKDRGETAISVADLYKQGKQRYSDCCRNLYNTLAADWQNVPVAKTETLTIIEERQLMQTLDDFSNLAQKYPFVSAKVMADYASSRCDGVWYSVSIEYFRPNKEKKSRKPPLDKVKILYKGQKADNAELMDKEIAGIKSMFDDASLHGIYAKTPNDTSSPVRIAPDEQNPVNKHVQDTLQHKYVEAKKRPTQLPLFQQCFLTYDW